MIHMEYHAWGLLEESIEETNRHLHNQENKGVT